MLVLSRKKGESLKIGDNVILTIVDIGGGKVRLGLDAPDEVKILRTEIEGREPRKPKGRGRA